MKTKKAGRMHTIYSAEQMQQVELIYV